MVVVVCAEGQQETDLPQGVGGAAANSGEGLAGAELLKRYVKETKSLHREHIEAGAAVDEGLGDGYLQTVGVQIIGSTPEPTVLTG